jgi:hypothetical protein
MEQCHNGNVIPFDSYLFSNIWVARRHIAIEHLNFHFPKFNSQNTIIFQVRLFRILNRRRKEGSSTSIDRLFLTNTAINCIFYPVLLIYLTVNLFVFPMSDYIGLIGCLVLPQFVDVFIRIYSFCFPISITVLR